MTRGWPTHWSREKDCFVYSDTDEPVDMDVPFGGGRGCRACDKQPTRKGHDACIPDLPDVSFACCGHGDPYGHDGSGIAYVTMKNGTYLRKQEALDFFASNGCTVPTSRDFS